MTAGRRFLELTDVGGPKRKGSELGSRRRRSSTFVVQATAVVLLSVGCSTGSADEAPSINEATSTTAATATDAPTTVVTEAQTTMAPTTSAAAPPTTAALVVPSIPLVGGGDDPRVVEAFARVEAAFAAFNSGDMDAWALWREGGQAGASRFAYELAAGSWLNVDECTYRGLATFVMDGPLTGHGFDCAAIQSDRLLDAAGIGLQMTYNWVIGEDNVSSLGGSNENFEVVQAFMSDYRTWLATSHADVEGAMTFRSGFDFPAPESVAVALEYIDEFVSQSATYPLTAVVPPGDYGGPVVMSPRSVIESHFAAYNAKDLAGVMVFYTEDSVITGHPSEAVQTDLDTIRRVNRVDMLVAAESNAYLITNLEVSGDTVTWDHMWTNNQGFFACVEGHTAVVRNSAIVSWTWPVTDFQC